jgi:putative aminopeptidase FrvX
VTPSEPVGGVPMGLLQELLWTYGPCGQEDAVREVCHRELRPVTDETWVDAAGNLVGLIRGHADSPATRVLAHMDELSMLVKRVEPDGTLHLSPLGTMYPANFGLGPVAILGDRETVCGVLPLGSEHTTKESWLIWETKPDQSELTMALEVGPTESEYATRVGGGPIVGYGDARSAIPAITELLVEFLLRR